MVGEPLIDLKRKGCAPRDNSLSQNFCSIKLRRNVTRPLSSNFAHFRYKDVL